MHQTLPAIFSRLRIVGIIPQTPQAPIPTVSLRFAALSPHGHTLRVTSVDLHGAWNDIRNQPLNLHKATLNEPPHPMSVIGDRMTVA
jgi:hypothetical protein